MSVWLLWLWEEIDSVLPCCSVKIGKVAQQNIDILAKKELWECKKNSSRTFIYLYLIHPNKTSPPNLLE